MDRVLNCLISDKIGPGKLSKELAHALTLYLSMAGGVCLSSYVAAIHFVFELYDVKPTDNVVLSPLCPALYLDALRIRGAQPLFADVHAESGTMQHEHVKRLLRFNPKLIVSYHPLGILEAVATFADYGVPVVEDASHALGGTFEGHRCGSRGDCAIISLAEGNIITAGGGALVACREKKMYLRLLHLTQQGSLHSFLPDMNAALGLAQIAKIDKLVASRRGIADIYSRFVMKSRHKLLVQKGEGDNVFFSFPVILNGGMREARTYAMRNNIETQPAFKESIINFDGVVDSCANASSLLLRCLLFPLYPVLRKQDINTVTRVLNSLP